MRIGSAFVLTLVTATALLCCEPLSATTAKGRKGTGVAPAPATFADLSPDTISNGFKTVAVYLNDVGKPFGARFVHQSTGFTLDLLDIQSVPQAFTCAVTYPVSDKGEPHTQEHLLVGKGNMGRGLAEGEQMSLTASNAYTMQWRTCYMFNTPAGAPVFYKQFQNQLNALLHPDYTDEEIRREVRNFGVSVNPGSKQLSLEEKGTVYNEMVSSSDRAIDRLFRQLQLDDYGPHHPLAYNSGGEPSGIRELLPSDIRQFHDEHYFLANLSSIVALPAGETVTQELAAFNGILDEVQPQPTHLPVVRASDLPTPQPAPAGSIQIVGYPAENAREPSYLALSWPADRNLDERGRLLLQLFLDSFAGDASTDLYRTFINSKTRQLDLGASSVASYLDDQSKGDPVVIFFEQVAAANLNKDRVEATRALVLKEMNHIASLPDGSPELLQFNTLAQNRLTELRRQLAKLLNSPPEFGARNTPSTWVDHLNNLNHEPGFRKPLTLKPDLDAIEQMLGSKKNIWKDLLAQWHLSDTIPYGVATQPSPDLLKQEQQERSARAAAEVKRLEATYNVADEQEALRRYQADYNAATAQLDQLAKKSSAKFLESPPLTLDDQLIYKTSKVEHEIPLVSSTFDNMTSATTGIGLRLNSASADDLVYLSLLPNLLTQVGVIENGTPLSYEDMQERLRKEILGLDQHFSNDPRTGRTELVVTGSGNDLTESKRALEWMRLVLFHPDWRPQNLPRIRDMVDQSIAELRATWQGPEESWVRNPMMSYYRQNDPLFLSTYSFLTRTYNANRIAWLLKDCDTPEHRHAAGVFLDTLSHAADNANRPDLQALLSALSAGPAAAGSKPATLSPSLVPYKTQYDSLPGAEKKIASDAVADMAYYLPNLPDGSLTEDWAYLLQQMQRDLAVTPEKALAQLDQLRRHVLLAGNARVWMVGATATQQQLTPSLQSLLAGLEPSAPPTAPASSAPLIDNRLRGHQKNVTMPHFVGLFDPNLNGGVIGTYVPFVQYDDTQPESLLNLLALQAFGGGGPHSVFTKTIGAGLAYSNGVGASQYDGYGTYYAERTPEIPQTLHFAINVVKEGPRDPKLLDYALAGAFSSSYAAASYEDRGAAIASQLADGVTPEKVRTFREALLKLRQDPKTADAMLSRIDTVYSNVLPGYAGAMQPADSTYFIIGNNKQFTAMDTDLAAHGQGHVYRLYPRDFWLLPVSSESTSSSRCHLQDSGSCYHYPFLPKVLVAQPGPPASADGAARGGAQ